MRGTKPIEGAPGLIEITDLNGFLADLKAAIGPTLDEHRDIWEREKPAAMASAEALGISIDNLGGNCPVQAEGSFDDKRFYFRARGEEWSLTVWPAVQAANYTDLPLGEEEWEIERDYGDSDFAAGWMHKHEAVAFICEGVTEFRDR